jgi:hypothetical protein
MVSGQCGRVRAGVAARTRPPAPGLDADRRVPMTVGVDRFGRQAQKAPRSDRRQPRLRPCDDSTSIAPMSPVRRSIAIVARVGLRKTTHTRRAMHLRFTHNSCAMVVEDIRETPETSMTSVEAPSASTPSSLRRSSTSPSRSASSRSSITVHFPGDGASLRSRAWSSPVPLTRPACTTSTVNHRAATLQSDDEPVRRDGDFERMAA